MNEKDKNSVIIVGTGPCGYMAAYELNKLNPDTIITLVDQGKDISGRLCPLSQHKLSRCPAGGCKPVCATTCGFGGGGAFSDGKFIISGEYGGWLNEIIEEQELDDLIHYVDSIHVAFGAPEQLTNPNTIQASLIEKRGMAVGLKLLRAQVRHLGTEKNKEILQNLSAYLRGRKNVEIFFETTVEDIMVENGKVLGVTLSSGEKIFGNNVVLAPGRIGSDWLSSICKKYDIPLTSNRVDIGVRVETQNAVMEEINDTLYEGKFLYRTSVGTQTRTFCSNPRGYVVIENNKGIMLANGHAFSDLKLGSENTNFALLVSHNFTEPFNQPNEFAKNISSLANMLSNGSVIIQRYGDLKMGRRSTDKRIREGFVSPTLKEAVPGDLGLVLPYKTMLSIIETIEALDHVTPGIASEHTLLYGVEAKFYSARPALDKNLQTKIAGLYAGGDGAGVTRGLAQAGASGVLIARSINEKYE